MDKAKIVLSVVSKMPKNQLTLMLMLGAGIVVGVGTVGYYIYNSVREQFEDAHQYRDNHEDGGSDSNSWTRSRRSSANSASSRGRRCTICLMDLSTAAGNITRLSECDHEFHEICITRWLRGHKTCPICRRTINSFFV